MEDVKRIKIADLQASLINVKVQVAVQIAGEASQKALPRRIQLLCVQCGHVEEIDFTQLQEPQQRNLFLENVVFGGKLTDLIPLVKASECKKGKGGRHAFLLRVLDYMDFAVLFVRDLLDPLVKFDQRVYKTRKVYLVNQWLPYVKKVLLEGTVFLEPKTHDITLIADLCQPYEDEVTGFQISEDDRGAWMKYFVGKTPEDLLTQIAPAMAERPLVQEALHLILHSVSVIPNIYGEPTRGSLRGILFGDTKTFKSRSVKDLTIEHYGFGDYIVGEASSRTGITYTIDNDNRALIWGALPMNDLGFLAIDGMHSLNREEWRETREALENQRVVVRRSLSGEALARTRVVGIYNPEKPMNLYLFRCQAAVDVFCFNDPPDVTRWDLFIPFSRQDVPEKEVAEAAPKERPILDEVYVRHVFWAWSRRPEDIEYTEEAKYRIVEETKTFMERYAVDSIPLVHLGYREVITRVAVAYAAWFHSTDSAHARVVVKEDHVDRTVEFLGRIAELLELGAYKMEQEGKLRIADEEMEAIITDLDQLALRILEQIKAEPKSSQQLADVLDQSIATIKRRYATLAKHQLIRTVPGKGVSLSPRGVIFLKENLGIKVSKNDTSGDEQESNLKTEKKPEKNSKPSGEQVSKNDTLIPTPSVGEKIDEIKHWIQENKDSDSLVDSTKLAEKIKGLDLEPSQIVNKLRAEGWIFKVNRLGKWGVTK